MLLLCGPNVIESEQHVINMAKQIQNIINGFDVDFYFKVSFDKANRTSLQSYRGPGFEEGLRILRIVKDTCKVKLVTDIHEAWQAKPVAEVVDMIQIPAFLCRQTDLLKAAAETGKIIHVKKGQMCSAEQMHKCKEKIIEFGNPHVILCERGNSFGYQDLVVDPRNLVWLKSDTNKVTMDITHSLQRPSQFFDNGIVKCGGYRELIPYMGKMAISIGVDGLFIEVHDNPEKAMCDAPTQWPLKKLNELLIFIGMKRSTYNFTYSSSTIQSQCELGTIEKDVCGHFGSFLKEDMRAGEIMKKFLTFKFANVLDIGAGELKHSKCFIDHNIQTDICDYGNSAYYDERIKNIENRIHKKYIGDFNDITFEKQYDAIWCSHILEHQLNVNLFLKKIHSLLKEGGYLAIVVPPRKPFVVGGHVTLWNAGLVLYNLILAGFDCSKDCYIHQYDYNIGVIIKKKSIQNFPKLSMDKGDIELLSNFFPFDATHNFNGDILSMET